MEHMLRFLLLPLLVGLGCGDDGGDDPPPPPVDAGRMDTSLPPDTGPGPDAAVDTGAPPPGDVISDELCSPSTGRPPVDVSSDGALIAYVTCGAAPKVLVRDVAAGTDTEIADAVADTSVQLSPDDAFVIYGADGDFSIRPVDASIDAISLADDPVVEFRYTPDGTRLLVLSQAGGDFVITRRDAGGGGPAELLRTPDFAGDLSLISSGSSTMLYVAPGPPQEYRQVALDGTGVADIPIDPTMDPVFSPGLGDTHGIARTTANGLDFIQLADAMRFEIAADGVTAESPMLVDEGFAYYVRNGDPVRRRRDQRTPMPEQVIDDTDITVFALFAPAGRLVYAADGALFSAPMDPTAGDVEMLVNGIGDPAEFEPEVSPDGTEIMLSSGSALIFSQVGTAGTSTVLDGAGVLTDDAEYGFSGDGVRAIWRRADGELRVNDGFTTSSIAAGTLAWWPRPGASDVFYASDDGDSTSTLRRLVP